MSKPPTQLTETGSLASNAPQQAASLAEPQPPSSPVAKQPFPKQPAALDDNEISALIKRGNSLLEEGDFAAARVLFEHAANAGSAEAALALGSTYDLLAIKRLGAIGVKPDIESARKWYQSLRIVARPPRRCSSPIYRQVVENGVGPRSAGSALEIGTIIIKQLGAIFRPV